MLQHVASDGSFFGKWEAKKARALARRKEQASLRVAASSSSGYRVSQPPGGASSIVLGPETHAVVDKLHKARQLDQARKLDQARQLAARMDDRVAAATTKHLTTSDERIHRALVGRSVSANVWANGASQNTGNFLSDRPTSRVLFPPGGRSSLTLG